MAQCKDCSLTAYNNEIIIYPFLAIITELSDYQISYYCFSYISIIIITFIIIVIIISNIIIIIIISDCEYFFKVFLFSSIRLYGSCTLRVMGSWFYVV